MDVCVYFWSHSYLELIYLQILWILHGGYDAIIDIYIYTYTHTLIYIEINSGYYMLVSTKNTNAISQAVGGSGKSPLQTANHQHMKK